MYTHILVRTSLLGSSYIHLDSSRFCSSIKPLEHILITSSWIEYSQTLKTLIKSIFCVKVDKLGTINGHQPPDIG